MTIGQHHDTPPRTDTPISDDCGNDLSMDALGDKRVSDMRRNEVRNCHWVKDTGIPGGKFLIPGCWNRVVYGDHVDCHCPKGFRPKKEEMTELLRRIETLEALVKR